MRISRTAMVVAVALGAGGAVAGPAQAATVNTTVVQFNVEKQQAAVNQAVATANRTNATGLTLQEVCENQLTKLKAQHPGWTVHAAQHSITAGNPNCRKGKPVYNVVVWRGGPGGTGSQARFTDSGQDGSAACLDFTDKGIPTRLCSTHLWAGDGQRTGAGEAVRLQQVGTVRSLVDQAVAANYSVIVGGDFNSKPGDAPLNPLWTSAVGKGGTGSFVDYNRRANNRRAGRATADKGKQIDYVFFATTRAKPALANGRVRLTPTVSDHHMYTATARLKR